jgi:hypothetical protein
MKKFSLLAFGFVYTLFNDQTLTKDSDGTKIQADTKGNVTLVTATEVTLGKKVHKEGASVSLKLSDIMSWVEEKDWVDVVAPTSEDAKKAFQTKLKELRGVEKTTSEEALNASDTDFVAKRKVWQAAKQAVEDFEKTAPASAKSGRKSITYTEAEQATITAYNEAVTAHKAAKEAVVTASTKIGEAAKLLPATYKVKGSHGNGGVKAPKLTPVILAEMIKAKNGEAYTAQGVSYPALVGGAKTSAIAKAFGYSYQYTSIKLK